MTSVSADSDSRECAGHTVLITGGGTGIGAATARLLARRGAAVAVLGPDQAPLDAVALETGAIPIVGDAASSVDVDRAVERCLSEWGGLTSLVCSAGISPFGVLAETTDEQWREVCRVNLDTAFVAARQCLPALRDSEGSIVVVSSLAGRLAVPGAVAYTTTKHALLGLVRSIAGDYGPLGVRANAVCPGFVRTAMSDSVMSQLGGGGTVDLDAAYARATRFTPLRRPATPEEIAEVIAFLAGPRSAVITGSVVTADGGVAAIETGSLAAFT